jgi:RNA polymerase sigma factor (sigma-70 family)
MTHQARRVKSDFLCGFQFSGCYKLNMPPDSELLARFARTNADDAFAELVRRHVNLVYSAALRQVNGDAHLAQDVAQTVFTDLARKAVSLARGRDASSPLTGWLYTSTHFAAAKMVRTENRRRDREEKFMREPTETAPEADWEKLRPTLDAAMHELKETDREAILLRYFENRSFAEVGAKLGLNENAARMRVERALEKLRVELLRRGVAATSALASVISANAVQLAPANLAAALTTTSIAAAGTGTLTFMKIMTAAKLKLAVSAIVVAGAATAIVIQQQTQNKLRAENESLTQQVAQLQTDNSSLSNQLANVGDTKKLSDKQFNELLKLRGEVGILQRQLGELGKLREENRQLQSQVITAQNEPSQLPTEAEYQQLQTETKNSLKELALAMRIYAGDHDLEYPTNFNQLTNELSGQVAIDGKFIGGVGLDDFEFVSPGLVNDNMPDKLILRERILRRTPDGKWERAYAFADDHIELQVSANGNFNDYEKKHMVLPPN